MNSRQHRAVTSARRETNEVSPRGTPACCLQRGVPAQHGQVDNSTMPGVLRELRTRAHGVGAGTKRPGSAWKGKERRKQRQGDPVIKRELFLCLRLNTDLCVCEEASPAGEEPLESRQNNSPKSPGLDAIQSPTMQNEKT